MSIKLNDIQLLLLSAASQRDDRCVVAPTGVKRRQALRAASQLLEAGYLKELRAKAETPSWRRDEESGLSYALKLTVAGAKAIMVEETSPADGANDVRRHETAPPVVRDRQLDLAAVPGEADGGLATGPSVPRRGTKIANVIALLERSGGATLEELIAVTGWLPHTTRAALTGLRKRGYALALDRTDKQRGSVYHATFAEILGDGVAPTNEPLAPAWPGPGDDKRSRRAA